MRVLAFAWAIRLAIYAQAAPLDSKEDAWNEQQMESTFAEQRHINNDVRISASSKQSGTSRMRGSGQIGMIQHRVTQKQGAGYGYGYGYGYGNGSGKKQTQSPPPPSPPPPASSQGHGKLCKSDANCSGGMKCRKKELVLLADKMARSAVGRKLLGRGKKVCKRCQRCTTEIVLADNALGRRLLGRRKKRTKSKRKKRTKSKLAKNCQVETSCEEMELTQSYEGRKLLDTAQAGWTKKKKSCTEADMATVLAQISTTRRKLLDIDQNGYGKKKVEKCV